MGDPKKQGDETSRFLPEIRFGIIDRLTIYQVSDSELEILARGSPNSVYLNFSIALLSIAVSFLIALLTTTINSNKVFTVFVVLTVIGAISGILFMCLWLKNRKSVSDLMDTIKKRLPPEGIQEDGSKDSSLLK